MQKKVLKPSTPIQKVLLRFLRPSKIYASRNTVPLKCLKWEKFCDVSCCIIQDSSVENNLFLNLFIILRNVPKK
jgi:hypothetical protein